MRCLCTAHAAQAPYSHQVPKSIFFRRLGRTPSADPALQGQQTAVFALASGSHLPLNSKRLQQFAKL